MTTAPDVLYLRGDQLFDATATAWDARNLKPLVAETAAPEPTARPLVHQRGCWMAPYPDLATLADLCACTDGLRYLRSLREATQ